MTQQTDHSVARQSEASGTPGKPSFVFRRTCDLSVRERDQFCELFTRVFQKEMDRRTFERKYCQTPLGHSHHGLMTIEERIVGAYNLVPYRYSYFGEKKLFGLSADAMIDAEHRHGPFNMVKMAKGVYRGAVEDGVVFAFGFPNDQAYAFTRKVLRWAELGDLDFFALPLNIGAFRQSLAWANRLSRLGAMAWVRLPRWSRPQRVEFPVQKVADEAFRRHRYDEWHGVIQVKGGGEATYCVYEEDDGVRVLYLIDVTPLTSECFADAVRKLHEVADARVDLMLYVGHLPFTARGLIRVPAAKRPRRIRMCGKILDPQGIDERILQIDNWNVNISNFDVR